MPRVQTLAALCGLEEPVALPSESAITPSFSDPMMIFAGLSEMTLNRVLAGLRAQQIRIPYKAILTPTNQDWIPDVIEWKENICVGTMWICRKR